MTTNGDVNITIVDNGSATLSVPAASTQLVIGCSDIASATTPASDYQIIASTSPATFLAYFGRGSLTEAAGLACLAGGLVLGIRVPITTKGTSTVPALTQGTGASTGTAVPSMAVDGTTGAFDDYYGFIRIVNGGALGTAGITFQVSLDAGRNWGPTISLGTSLTYAITGTGLTITFGLAAATLVTGNYIKWSTVGPAWARADVDTALAAYKASPYSNGGVGSVHIVGGGDGATTGNGPACSTSDVQALSNGSTGYLDALTASYLYSRAIITVRDASCPAAYGGSGESEATWMTAVELISSLTTGNNGIRLCVNAGYYNTPTAFPLAVAGTPSYRRPLAWSLAAREVAIPPQRHAGRVKDGPLGTIVVNPAVDPTDGFVYHDERINPGLDAAKFSSARTRIGLGAGFYIVNPNLMSTPGSVFTLLPLGNVMDVACVIVHEVGQQEINDDLRLNSNGTIYENDARAIESAIGDALQTNMLATNEISGFTVAVDRTNNVQSTSTVNIAVTIQARGYVLTENVTISYLSSTQAA